MILFWVFQCVVWTNGPDFEVYSVMFNFIIVYIHAHMHYAVLHVKE